MTKVRVIRYFTISRLPLTLAKKSDWLAPAALARLRSQNYCCALPILIRVRLQLTDKILLKSHKQVCASKLLTCRKNHYYFTVRCVKISLTADLTRLILKLKKLPKKLGLTILSSICKTGLTRWLASEALNCRADSANASPLLGQS